MIKLVILFLKISLWVVSIYFIILFSILIDQLFSYILIIIWLVLLLILMCNCLFRDYICKILTTIIILYVFQFIILFLFNFLVVVCWSSYICFVFIVDSVIRTICSYLLCNMLHFTILVHFFIFFYFWANFFILSLKIVKLILSILIFVLSLRLNARFLILWYWAGLIMLEILIEIGSICRFFITGCHIN